MHVRKQAATDGNKRDLNIGETRGFGGFDFLGQIYNLEKVWNRVVGLVLTFIGLQTNTFGIVAKYFEYLNTMGLQENLVVVCNP